MLPDNGNWFEEAKRKHETRRPQERQLQEKRRQVGQKERQERALSADERHQLYSKVLEELPLDSATVTDLRQRDFTDEEISRSRIRSVKQWQKLNSQYNPQLPGIGKDGKSLAVRNDAYLCPLFDFEGRIVAFQQRLHNPQDGNRYRWLSTPDRATLKLQPEDENPLTVLHPSGNKPEGIAIVEGTGCKPFFVSERLNLLTIGASGGQWLSSEKLLEKYIKAAINKYGELPIKVFPDSGWALNWQVKQQLVNIFDWLKNKFGQSNVFVSDWNQIHKSQGDIDELQNLSIVRNLQVESFLKKYKEVFGDKGFASKRYLSWAESRVKLSADMTQHEQWLNIPEGIQNECDILLVRKALGGGKTQALIKFLKPLNTVSLLVGYRNSLLNNTISRANQMGLNALHVKNTMEKVGGNYINFAADDSIKLWGGCADSFFKFNAVIDRNPEYYLVHDEICSVLGHLKGGGTLKGRQQQAIEWDVNTIRNSRFAIMMDANLCDRDIDFIRLLFPEKRIKVLDSVYPTTPRTFYFTETEASSKDYTMLPKYLPSQLMEKAKAANRVLWISDSQRSCEIADEILTKQGHKHFRLDGKTSHDELSKQLQSAPKEFIITEKLDSLSLSPSAESGLSIDLYGYFDAVCFDIRGTIGVNALTQLSARLRDTNVPIYVACPEFVNITSDPCPYVTNEVHAVLNQRIDMLLAKAMQVDNELVNSQFVVNMFVEMAQKFSQDPWFLESLKDAKQLKYEHQNLKLTLKTALAQAGHRVIDLVETPDEGQYDEVVQTKELVKRREAEKIFNSENIDWEKAQELSKTDVNYDTKCVIRKARLKHQLPGIEQTQSWNSDFVYMALLDQPQFINKRWRLKQFQDERLAQAVFKSEKKYNFEFGFAPTDIWKSTSTKLEALKLLGVGKIIEANAFSCQDDWVQQIVNEYYDNPDWFNLIGISKAKRTFNDDGSPKNLRYVKEMVDRFLDFFGFESKQSKKTRNNRSYTVTTPNEVKDYLPDIDKSLDHKAETILEEMREISLKEIVDKAEQTQRQQQEWEQQQAELNKRMLEDHLTHTHSDLVALPSLISISQTEEVPHTEVYKIATTEMEPLTHTHSDLVALPSLISISQTEEVPHTEVYKIATTEMEEWSKPESIADVAPSEPPKKPVASAFKIGDRVTHSDVYHFRGNQHGTVEGFNDFGEVIIRWLEDGDNQKAAAHRSHPEKNLRMVA
jgi:cell division protein ZapA (FtsZ GTPase activity inhibitor)